MGRNSHSSDINNSNSLLHFSTERIKRNTAELFRLRRNSHQSGAETATAKAFILQPIAYLSIHLQFPLKINTQLFHHTPRFTTQSLMSVLAPNVTAINHLLSSIKVSGELALIKWTFRSKCKWPIVDRVEGWPDFQQEVFGGRFGRGAFIWLQSRSD